MERNFDLNRVNSNRRDIKPQAWFAHCCLPLSIATGETHLEHLRDYLPSAQSFVSRMQQTLTRRINDAIELQKLQGEDKDLYRDLYEDEFHQLYEAFPRIVYSSTLLTAFSLFESSLTEVCRCIERDAVVPIEKTLDNFKDPNSLKRAAGFLKANFRIYLHKHTRWNDILSCYRIRNCIAHAYGDVPKMQLRQSKKIESFVKQNDSFQISLTDSGRLEFGFEFISVVIDQMLGFWNLLDEACQDNAILGPPYWPDISESPEQR